MDVLVTLLGFKKKIIHYFFPCFFSIDQLTVVVGFCDFSSLIRDFSELTWLVVTILNHLAIVGFGTLGRLHCSVPHNSTLLNCLLQDFFFLEVYNCYTLWQLISNLPLISIPVTLICMYLGYFIFSRRQGLKTSNSFLFIEFI